MTDTTWAKDSARFDRIIETDTTWAKDSARFDRIIETVRAGARPRITWSRTAHNLSAFRRYCESVGALDVADYLEAM